MTKLVDFIPKTKLILHSHEIFEHYLLSKRLVPDFVVSERIADQYEQHFQLRPNIQPPFLLNSKEILRMAEEPVEPIKNECGIMDLSKVTLCMCGQINERKNFNLFIEVAKRCPQYNFLWIGGTEDPFENIENVFHVKYTSNPYKYFKNIVDYFVLFSKQDPCPYVILENILLETQIVTFRENIFFDHKHRLTKEFYFEYPGAISLENVINALKLYVKGKKTKSISQEGLHYIEEFFRFPSAIIQSVETHLKGTFYRDELMSF
jgi:glycosyltransferase involved in cell wall biosynthesis